MRRTKIVATLGPATDTPEALDAVLRAGVDVARINFSHGGPEEHLGRVKRFREASARAGKVTAVLADLPGPKLRNRLTGPMVLTAGGDVAFSLTETPRHAGDICITEPELLADVKPGHRILLDDGRLQLEAVGTADGRLTAKIIVGGTLLPKKGINLPDTPLTIAAVTDIDRAALAVAMKAGADWLALSFVRGPEAADELRAEAAKFGFQGPVLAKMERPEAVERAAAIVAAFDGVMVARGDLGVEIPLEKVPMAQKFIIAEARAAGKPVITATDMLDSMRTNPRPTRAEASDVANAIYDGTDAVMLSGETAVGEYPVEAVACMARIAEETERHLHAAGRDRVSDAMPPNGEAYEPIVRAAAALAREIGADAIVTPTLSGRTGRMLAKYRPWPRVVAPAPAAVLNRMAVVWGLHPVLMAKLGPGEDRMIAAVRDAFRAGAVKAGELLVVLAGHPIEAGPRFPTVRVVRVGEGGSSLEP